MKVRKSRLVEVRLNNHQQHLEDLVLFGEEGLNELNDKIEKFLRRFEGGQGELNLTQKIDGAPALFCWSKFPGYPDNSIALKGFTNGPSTALSTHEQIDAKYGDRPDMAAKLKLGLELAKYIPAGECWQGDCLFSKGDIREEEINGTNYLTFQPNKIVYAFSENNADYNKVKNSDFGIAFHTIYTGDADKKSQSFNVDPTKINAPDNFYIMSPAINASSNKEDYDIAELENEFNNLKSLEQKLINDPAYEELVNNSTFMNYWNTFENANLADKKQVNININTFIQDLKDYVKNKQTKEYNKKLDAIKTDQGREKALAKYNSDVEKLDNIIETNKGVLTNLVNVLNSAANIKMMMWSGLRQAKNDYSTFYKSRTKGYFPAEGEGIAMSDMDGNIVKIVDRSNFSSFNRDPDIMSGFEHESLNLHEEFKLDQRLDKLLSDDKKQEFINTIRKIAINDPDDLTPVGTFRPEEESTYKGHTDHKGRDVWDKIVNRYKFWLNNFGLDISKRGVGGYISRAILDMNSSLEDDRDEEWLNSLAPDDKKRLPPDEQFKIDLFYEWDAEIRKNFWGTYEDDDPIRELSFNEYLQYRLDNGEYDNEYEKQLIKDAIEETKDGFFYEDFAATQRGDMGSFNKSPLKLLNKKLVLDEDNSKKTAVIAFGRFNPPTIGHEKLVDTLASVASANNADPMLFLSHSVNNPKNPLSYSSKINWCKKAFGDKVDIVDTQANNALQALTELYNKGYTDIIYVGGSDRIGGKEDMTNTIKKYNGSQTKTGEKLYDFDSINFVNAGIRDDESDDLTNRASASLARKYVIDNDFESFKNIVPFNETDAYNLFKQLKYALKGANEAMINNGKNLNEANAGENYEIEATNYLNNKYSKELPGVEFKHMGGNDNSKPDILVNFNDNTSKDFYIECKDLPAQAGEFALRIENDNLTFLPNQNTSEEEGGKDTQNDIKCKQNIVDWLNNSSYKDKIINDYSLNGEVNIRIKDSELIDLMKDRIKTHYGNMNADWFCAPSKDSKYAFVLVNKLEQLMNVDAVTVRNKSNNSKNISVASYDSFNDFAKSNGFTDLIRTKRGKENVVTFNSNKDLGLKNPKQNIRILIDDKEYVITINTHPTELPGMYMLRNSSRGNIKILASLGKAKSGIDAENDLIQFIKDKIKM